VGAGPITRVAITAPRKIDIERSEPWAQLVSGASFSCARSESGRTYCWGYSREGALGSGGASSPLPVTVQLAP
jgi:alpha-tubulin suppressor-like RCC1 family protein